MTVSKGVMKQIIVTVVGGGLDMALSVPSVRTASIPPHRAEGAQVACAVRPSTRSSVSLDSTRWRAIQNLSQTRNAAASLCLVSQISRRFLTSGLDSFGGEQFRAAATEMSGAREFQVSASTCGGKFSGWQIGHFHRKIGGRNCDQRVCPGSRNHYRFAAGDGTIPYSSYLEPPQPTQKEEGLEVEKSERTSVFAQHEPNTKYTGTGVGSTEQASLSSSSRFSSSSSQPFPGNSGSSSSREYGAAQEGSLTSSSLGESRSRSGRRTFLTVCLFALAAYAFVGRIGEAQAEGAPAKPEKKKKGRAPSSPYDEDRLLDQNRRMQRLNNAPTEFPGFVREGFQVKVITSDKYVTSNSGLIYYDMVVGNGDLPKDGQQVIFHYTGYNESGRRVDSSYQQGRPARTRVGIQGMIPGFEEGIKSMRPGGRRIIIVPPELGPPVGPSTFFSAKQFEVFDVELLEAKDCSRRTLLFYSDVVCD